MSCWKRASACEPKNRFEMTVKNCFLFESFRGARKGEFKTISVMKPSFLSEKGAALTFFASVFCVMTKNEVRFGRIAQ